MSLDYSPDIEQEIDRYSAPEGTEQPSEPSEQLSGASTIEVSYQLTPEDSRIVSLASQTFADDYRYLLDMVTTAGKASRVRGRSTEPSSLKETLETSGEAG